MLREAELFVMAQDVLVEVVGRIRPEHEDIRVPPGLSLAELVGQLARADAELPDVLAGLAPNGASGDDHRLLADAATQAARKADDPDLVVQGGSETLGVREYLLRATVRRAFAAHDIAMHLGSRACPLTEELARGLWEITEPDAARWRALGIFREPQEPMPPDVSWRDRFLISAGKDPHPLEH